MDLADLDSFQALMECVRNIDKKITKIERELLCPSLFGDPFKTAASEEFVDKRIEEVINIKEHIKNLIEDTRHSLEVQEKFNEQLSTTKNSLIQQLVETECHLKKYGYEPLQNDYGDLEHLKNKVTVFKPIKPIHFLTTTKNLQRLNLPPKEEESCDESKKITEDSCISDEEVVTRDFEDLNLSYKECLTPFVSVEQSRSNTKILSDKPYIPRKLVDDESIVFKSTSNQTITANGVNETLGYSETFYELERKYKMYKQNQKGQKSTV